MSWLLIAIWCFIYIVHYYHNRSTPSPLLPGYPNAATRRTHVKTSLRFLQFKVTITAWNGAHDRLVSILSKRRHARLVVFLECFYILGSVFGALGMLVALGLLLRVSAISGGDVLQKLAALRTPAPSPAQDGAYTLARRSVADPPTARTLSTITPIIPGYTVPLNHLPIIVLAVFFSQAVHELGHAIAAALSALPMLAAGASFTICIPAAFVSFPTTALQALRPSARARVISAGAFHNIVLWGVLLLVTRLGIATTALSWVSGYRNISHLGQAVVDVAQDSPLAAHLLPGTIITMVDDTSLAYSADAWLSYLAVDEHRLPQGWCLPDTMLGSPQEACCSPSHTSHPQCFTSPNGTPHACIDPVPILTRPNDHARCISQIACEAGSTCVFPSKTAQLVRLTDVDDKVVLWNGPASEVLEEVRVSSWVPRVPMLPRVAPLLLATFWEYLQMATLSLFFFNLLPVPFLDGAELLEALVDFLAGGADAPQGDAFAFDVEGLQMGRDGGRGSGMAQRSKRHVMRYVPAGTLGMVVLYTLLSLANALL